MTKQPEQPRQTRRGGNNVRRTTSVPLAVRQLVENRVRSRARIAAMTELKNRHYEEYAILYQQKKIELTEEAIEELESGERPLDRGPDSGRVE